MTQVREVLVVEALRANTDGTHQLVYRCDTARGSRELHRRLAPVSGLKRLGLPELLACGDPTKIAKALAGRAGRELGAALCAWLFGDENEQGKIFGALLGENLALGRPNVLSFGDGLGGAVLELRFEPPELLAQPWHLLAWGGRYLVGEEWDIRCTRAGEAAEVVELPIPPAVLIVVPELQTGKLRTPAHVDAVKTRLLNAGSTHVEVVSTAGELREAAGRRWHVVYYYGHGRLGEGGVPELVFGQGSEAELPLTELNAMLAHMQASIVYVNACSTGSGGWYGAGNLLSASGRIALSHLCPVEATQAIARGTRFFERLLGGEPPARCFLPDAADISDERPEWLYGSVHTSVRVWKRKGEAVVPPRDDLWALRLDRTPQRDRVFAEINHELARQATPLRGVAFLAVANAGNHLCDLGRQLLACLREAAAGSLGARSVVVTVGIPADTKSSAAWDDELLDAIKATPGAKLRPAFENYLFQKGIEPSSGVVVWLDFATHSYEERPFKISTWIDHAKRWTSEIDLAGVRLVFYAGFESLRGFKWAAVREAASNHAIARIAPDFRAVVLEELKDADNVALLELFQTSPHLRLSFDEKCRVATNILDHCQAPAEPPRPVEYASVVRALLRGHETQWADFLKPPAPDPGGKEDLL